jgi:hypothetical protein
MDPYEENGRPVPPKVDLRKQSGQPQHLEPTVSQELPPQKPTPTAARPTVIVKPMPVALDPSERHQTMQINPADLGVGTGAPAPSPSPTVSVRSIGLPSMPGAQSVKRETSRIPLELAKPSFGAQSRPLPGPSTIRVKPVVIRQTVDLTRAAPDGLGEGAPVPPVSLESGKRNTSRISLESVLSGQPGAPSQTAEISPPEVDDEPRTIRIKRSSDRPSLRSGGTSPVAAQTSPGQTARLELPPETPAVAPGEAGSQTPTRKKTIKVKRTGQDDGDEEAPAAVARLEPVARATEDVPHPTFGFLAVVASLVGVALMWVLMAQAFGRDISLTQLSYGWRDCPFSWFGQLRGDR